MTRESTLDNLLEPADLGSSLLKRVEERGNVQHAVALATIPLPAVVEVLCLRTAPIRVAVGTGPPERAIFESRRAMAPLTCEAAMLVPSISMTSLTLSRNAALTRRQGPKCLASRDSLACDQRTKICRLQPSL